MEVTPDWWNRLSAVCFSRKLNAAALANILLVEI